MTIATSRFIRTWTPSFYSTLNRVELRNVRQGGNDFLAAVPQANQAMWAGNVMSRVSEVTQGPLKLIAYAFSWLFHPLIGYPLSIISCTVKERLYESSIEAKVPEQIQHFEYKEVQQSIAGTIPIVVEGTVRHFPLMEDRTFEIENSIELEENGQKKRYHYTRLNFGAPSNTAGIDRTVVLNGIATRIRPNWEISFPFTKITIENKHYYFKIGNEVKDPIQGTISIGSGWRSKHYLIDQEQPKASEKTLTIHTNAQKFHYEPGIEIDAPQEGSRSFFIHGKTRHFASAKHILRPTLGFSGAINLISLLPFKLPTHLSRIANQAFEFTNKHMSNIIRIALLVSSAVFMVFSEYSMAAGVLLAVSYEYLDHDLGIIPRKVSLFMERWMPMISMGGLLVVGSLWTQAMAGCTLLCMIPPFNLWLHQKISALVRPILMACKEVILNKIRETNPHAADDLEEFGTNLENLPILEEFDAPLLENKNLSKKQIETILNGKNEDYEFNPAHYTKEATASLQLPQNHNFNELIRLWDEIGTNWTTEAAFRRILKSLVDDQRFIRFIRNRFPEAKRFHYEKNWNLDSEKSRKAHLDQFVEWIRTLAREKGCTKEQFAASWAREQLACFVDKLKGDLPIEGEQRYLEEAIQNTAEIIPFLQSTASQIDKEDAVLKLAIEGGNYCSLAMKRASGEVLDGFKEPLLQAKASQDPQLDFEMTVRLTLQKTRNRILQNFYREAAIESFGKKEAFKDTSEDIHLYTAITKAMKRDFYPLSKTEMDTFDFTQLLFKETIFLPIRLAMEENYKEQIPNDMREIGIDRTNQYNNKILEYLRVWVQKSRSLSAAEKEELLGGSLMNDIDHLIDSDNYPKWGRLLLFVLGIIREKKPRKSHQINPI